MASLWPFTLRYLPKPRPVKAVVCAFSVAIAICIYSTYPFPISFFRPTLDESLLFTKYQYPSLNPDLYPLKPLKSECKAHNLTTASAVPSFPPIEPSEINEVTPSTVLLITASKDNRYWVTIMEHLLVPYEVFYLSEIPRPTTSPFLDRLERPDLLPIGLIIFEDFAAYIALPLWQRHALDDYCRANKIGVIGFLKDGQSFSTEPGSLSQVGTLPLYLHRLLTHPWGLFVANNVSMLRITRGGRMRPGPLLFPDPPIQGTAPVCCQATLVPWPGLERYFVPLVFTRIEVKSGHPAMTSSCVGNRYWITIMEHLLVPYEVLYLSEIPRPTTSPLLDRLERPDSLPIGLIIFEDFAAYIALPLWQRHALDDYCRANKIGVIGFLKDGQSFSTEPGSLSRVGTLPLYLHRLLTHPWGLFVANNVSMLRITRGGRMRPGPLLFPDPPIKGTAPVCCQATLVPWPGLERYFVPLVFTRIEVKSGHPAMTSSCVLSRNASLNETRNEVYQSLVLEDLGLFDGIHRVLFAMSADSFWLNSMLILDAIVYLGRPSMRASPLISTPPYSPSYTPLAVAPYGLTRWILIDIDDVFNVGVGTPYTEDDALALVLAQHRWRQWISNFTFNLGFCGQYYEYPSGPDLPGYQRLLKYRDSFWWFDHLWNHQQAHQLTRKQLVESMLLNKLFARVKCSSLA
ncbi:unnamed protein product [Dicrocoelium dendriticum]|nr:unnamed protein product [Dicrocoelium dendriticum]